MRVAILTFDGFNEIDSFVAQHILCRVRQPGWEVLLASPTPSVTSMNGVTVQAQMKLDELGTADAVIVGSGVRTRELVADQSFLDSLVLDDSRQLIGSQCSGALLLAKLGLLTGIPACTDMTSKPWVMEAGVEVLNQPFFAKGRIATAGGCLASQYLATWIISSLIGTSEAAEALRYVAPVGERDIYVERALANVEPYLMTQILPR